MTEPRPDDPLQRDVALSCNARAVVWLSFVNLRDSDETSRCARWMSGDERSRWLRLAVPSARRQHAVARALLRTTLSRHADVAPADWRFETNRYGKPQIAGPQIIARDLRFNLSHTDGLVALAVAEGVEVGIDAENVHQEIDALELARIAFAGPEIEALERSPKSDRRRRFFDCWTLKEAYAKARGLGISLAFDAFSFELDHEDKDRDVFTPPDGDSVENWSFRRLSPTADHVVALAAQTKHAAVSVRHLREESL